MYVFATRNNHLYELESRNEAQKSDFNFRVTVCRVGVDYSCQLNILAWKIFCVQNRTLTKMYVFATRNNHLYELESRNEAQKSDFNFSCSECCAHHGYSSAD